MAGLDEFDFDVLLHHDVFEYEDGTIHPTRARVHANDWANVELRGPEAELRPRPTYLPARQALEDERVLLQEPDFHRATGVQPVGLDPVSGCFNSFSASISCCIFHFA